MLKKFGSIWVLCLLLVICSVTACNNGQVQPPESGKDGVSIVWKGSFASADEIENPQYLWAYYNTTDGCSYIYDGEKWTLLAGKAPETGAGAGSDTPVLDGFIPEATEVFVVTYQTDYAATPQQFYCMPGYKIPAEKLPQLTETHHDFGGWFDGETSVSNGYVIQKNTTLKAKWSKKKFTITYVCEDFTPPDPVVLEYGTVLDEQYFPDISNGQCSSWAWEEENSYVGYGYTVDHDAVFYFVNTAPSLYWGCLLNGVFENMLYAQTYIMGPDGSSIPTNVYPWFGIITQEGDIYWEEPYYRGKASLNDSILGYNDEWCISLDVLCIEPGTYKVCFAANGYLCPVYYNVNGVWDTNSPQLIYYENDSYFENNTIPEDYYFTITIPETNP